MLDMNTLVPEILIGVGAAIFIGSLLALLRQRTPAGLLTKHPSHRPRAVADEQLPEPAESTKASKRDRNTERKTGISGAETSGQESSNADVTSADNQSAETQTFRLRRARTIFFMVAGFLVTVWGIATILARG